MAVTPSTAAAAAAASATTKGFVFAPYLVLILALAFACAGAAYYFFTHRKPQQKCVLCSTRVAARDVHFLLPCTHVCCPNCSKKLRAELAPIPLPPIAPNASTYKFGDKPAAPPADLLPPKPRVGPLRVCPLKECDAVITSTCSEAHFRAAILPVPEVKTMAEGYKLELPFVLRHKYHKTELPQFDPMYGPEGTEYLLKDFEKNGATKVFGYDLQTNYVHLTLGDAVRMYKDRSLNLNFFDPRVKVFDIPPALCVENQTPATQEHSFTMTAKGRHTPLHTDPVSAGGGWMHLAEGYKVWTFFDVNLIDDFLRLDAAHSRLPDFHSIHLVEAACDPTHPLHRDLSFAFTGKQRAYQVIQGPGDFIYFPYGWVHSVDTLKLSIGLAWYMFHTKDVPRMYELRDHIWSLVGREDVWPSISKTAASSRDTDIHGLLKDRADTKSKSKFERDDTDADADTTSLS